MAKTATILGPYAPKDLQDSAAKTTIQSAIVAAIGANTPVSADPQVILGNLYFIVTTV
jgi:hypothetical protein